jgi:hypothetical protein
MSVATGFFKTAADRITARKDYIRDKKAKDRDYLMTYGTQAVNKIEAAAKSAIGTASILEQDFDISPDNIKYLVETSGVAGLEALKSKLEGYAPNVLKATDFNEMFKQTDSYKPSDQTLVEAINKSFGLYKDAAGSNPVDNKHIGLLSSMGIDLFGNESEEFRTAGGYSESDVRRMSAQASPVLEQALPFDSSKLPVVLDAREAIAYDSKAKDRIEEVATMYQSKLATTDNLRQTIQTLVNNGDYEALSKIPELRNSISTALIKMEEGIPGSISSNGYLLEFRELLKPQEPVSQEEYFNMKKSRSSEKNWAEKGLTTYSDLESAGFVFATGAEAMEAIESGMIPEGQAYLIGNKLGFNEPEAGTGSVEGGSVGAEEDTDIDMDQVYEGLDDNQKAILEAEAYVLMTRHPEMRPAKLIERLERYKDKNFGINTTQNMSPANDAEIAELIEAERNRLKNQFTEITEATLDRKLKAFEDKLRSR